jgi:hypothetical protein
MAFRLNQPVWAISGKHARLQLIRPTDRSCNASTLPPSSSRQMHGDVLYSVRYHEAVYRNPTSHKYSRAVADTVSLERVLASGIGTLCPAIQMRASHPSTCTDPTLGHTQRRDEKKMLFAINSNQRTKYPLQEGAKNKLQRIKTPWQKVYVLLQALLSNIDIADWSVKHEALELVTVFARVTRAMVSFLVRTNCVTAYMYSRLAAHGLLLVVCKCHRWKSDSSLPFAMPFNCMRLQ